VDAADVELPEAAESESPEGKTDDEKTTEKEEVPSGFERVLTLFRDALRDEVEEVKRSQRLTDSPCCLVNPSGAGSTQLQKVMHLANKDFAMAKRIFEINPSAGLIRRLAELTANPDHDNFVRDCGRQLYANALLMEGLAPDPEATANRMQQFMTELAAKRSPIVT
jgi:molecular chaperone HtpG